MSIQLDHVFIFFKIVINFLLYIFRYMVLHYGLRNTGLTSYELRFTRFEIRIQKFKRFFNVDLYPSSFQRLHTVSVLRKPFYLTFSLSLQFSLGTIIIQALHDATYNALSFSSKASASSSSFCSVS